MPSLPAGITVGDCWQFHLFGRVRVLRSPVDAPLRLSPLSESLLAYLLMSRERRVSRRAVIETFWNDQPEQRARRSLATALWRLRRGLEARGDDCDRGGHEATSPLRVTDTTIRVDRDCWVDVTHFERTARSMLPVPAEQASTQSIRGLQEAVALYRGDLLESLTDEWAVRERERYQLLLQDCLAYLLRHYAVSGAYDEALGYGVLLLEQDGLREDIHREMIRLYARSGRRALAIRQYEICRETLAVELGVAPMGETRRLLDWVMGGIDEEPLALDAPSFSDLSAMLRTALDAQRALQVVIDELSRQGARAGVSDWPQHQTVRPFPGRAS
ncbi:MAG: winged helix-turn-helix domain-containing protein [Dehalococcoidia bacterium]|nr:winged helix-turn-helix domain-containing protein [Dehalococcoidia bacterium]